MAAPRKRAVLALALVLAAGAVDAGSSGAQAAPTPSITEVERSVAALREKAEQASERYNDSAEALASAKVKVEAARMRHRQQQAQVERARRSIGLIAAETYRRGGTSTLSVLLSDDPLSALEQAGVLPSLQTRQAGALSELQESERRLAQDEQNIARQTAQLSLTEVALRDNRLAVEASLAAAERQLAGLRESERAALASASRSRERAALDAVIGAGRSADSCADAGVSMPSGRVGRVLAFACAQVGEPYEWGADGPGSWDCSGLTQQAWAAAGVSLPHSSKAQATYGTPVSGSQLRAGDLVFYHSPISHVAIYLGQGLMLHAPSSGELVKIVPLRSGMTAAVRL